MNSELSRLELAFIVKAICLRGFQEGAIADALEIPRHFVWIVAYGGESKFNPEEKIYRVYLSNRGLPFQVEKIEVSGVMNYFIRPLRSEDIHFSKTHSGTVDFHRSIDTYYQ